MHFFYASYWFLLPLALVLLYVRGNLRGFRSLILAETIVYFGCYLVFMFWPVTGPHYQFPMISGELADGAMYKWVHWMLEDGDTGIRVADALHYAHKKGFIHRDLKPGNIIVDDQGKLHYSNGLEQVAQK